MAKSRIARAYLNLGTVHFEAGSKDQASELLHTALQMFEKLAEAQPDSRQYQYAVAEVRLEMAMLTYQRGEFVPAANEFQQTLGLLDSIVPPTERVLTARANCLVGLGHALKDMGKPKVAAEEYQRAIVVREKLLQEQPFPAFRSELARCYGSLGQVLDLAEAQRPRHTSR